MPMRKCKRCGECCELPELSYPSWWRSEPEYLLLTEKQIESLMRARKKYPKNETACEILVYEDKKAICLMQKVLKKKPKVCQDYKCWE